MSTNDGGPAFPHKPTSEEFERAAQIAMARTTAKRGARVVDQARFADSCEGLTPAIVRAEQTEAHRRDRAELNAIGWTVVGIVAVLLPLAAFVAAIIAIWKAL